MARQIPSLFVLVYLVLVTSPNVCSLTLSPKIQSALVDIRLARIPQDLEGICECRNSDPEIVKAALPKFLTAESLSTGASIGIVAKERLYPFRVLGCIDVQFRRKSGRALVQNVYVQNEARGLGLGRRMMDFVEELARKQPEMERLELYVDTNNIVAVSLYEKCGFDTPGIHSAVNSLGRTAGVSLQIAMAKSLS